MSENADPYEAGSAGQARKRGMVATLQRAVGMAAHQRHPDHCADVWHAGEHADRQRAAHADGLNDAGNPKSDGYVRGDGAEVDDRQEPQPRKLQRLGESMLAWTSLVVIGLEIG